MNDARPWPAYIAVGSNLDPQRHITAGLLLLKQALPITGISTFHQTAPLERTDQPDYYNGVVAVHTQIGARELKYRVLKKIEQQMGRQPDDDRNTARTIDLDLILYADEVIDEPGLRIPHPDLSRPFVAGPILELAPDIIVPDSGRPLHELIDRREIDKLKPLTEFTQRLKGRLRA
jgi:2-amino-4-hydroxy-6-hydroxymethyldihydropteridine diphosphokinase